MSIVIIGGHERMESQYKEICRKYKCKAKVFTIERSHSSGASALIGILEQYA